VAVFGVGCTKAEDARTTTHQGAAARKMAEAPASGLEKLLLDLQQCGLEGHQITSTCPAMEALTTELRHRAPAGDPHVSVALGTKLLANRAPAVRVQAAAMLGSDPASRDAIVDAARRESDNRVREAMIASLASDGARNPRVGAFLLESTQHPDRAIRAEALAALTLPESRSLPGGPQRVLAMAESDPDRELRRAACADGGKLGDPSFISFYERATANLTDPEMYAACMEGVVAMFHNQPAFDTASEPAYRLYLRRVAATPRTEQSPPWQVMSAFCYDAHEADPGALAAWKRTATWFDANEVKTALSAVITDHDASWKARAAAGESMVGLGATKSELKALEIGGGGSAPTDTRVMATLDRAIAE